MPRFAANLGYLFTERPLLERIDAAAAAGFRAIELQFPYDVPADAVKGGRRKKRLTILGPQHATGARRRIRARRRYFRPPGGMAGDVHAGARLCERNRRDRDPLSRRQGRARAAAGSERVFSTTRCMLPSCGGAEHQVSTYRADQPSRRSELFSQSGRACCRHHRKLP